MHNEEWGDQRIRFLSSFDEVAPNKILVTTTWTDSDGAESQGFHVITHREGKISDLQDCKSRRAAERFARRH